MEVFLFVIVEALVSNVSMLLLCRSVRCWRMVCAIVRLFRFLLGVGARIRYSRCTKSHQKGADSSDGVDAMMALMILACSCWNIFLFVFLR